MLPENVLRPAIECADVDQAQLLAHQRSRTSAHPRMATFEMHKGQRLLDEWQVQQHCEPAAKAPR